MTTTANHRGEDAEPDDVACKQLYDDFVNTHVMPLWTQREEMMGCTSRPSTVPSWQPLSISTTSQLDLFWFGDDPVYEAAGLDRVECDGAAAGS